MTTSASAAPEPDAAVPPPPDLPETDGLLFDLPELFGPAGTADIVRRARAAVAGRPTSTKGSP